MIHLLGMLALFLTPSKMRGDACLPVEDSTRRADTAAAVAPAYSATDYESPSPFHVLTSAYGTVGRYTTETDLRSASGYITLTNSWRDYYTLGYANLWLERSDTGGKYYSQYLVAARVTQFLTERISLNAHYGFLREGEIQSYSDAATFQWMGTGANYWFSLFQVAGSSFSLSLSKGNIAASAYRGYFSFDAAKGIWLTSGVTITDTEWSPTLFSFRQTVSVPFGNQNYIIATADVGRRGFYLDDEALVAYNQRTIQTGSYLLKGIIQIFPSIYLIPSFEYDTFDGYVARYGTIGLRAVF